MSDHDSEFNPYRPPSVVGERERDRRRHPFVRTVKKTPPVHKVIESAKVIPDWWSVFYSRIGNFLALCPIFLIVGIPVVVLQVVVCVIYDEVLWSLGFYAFERDLIWAFLEIFWGFLTLLLYSWIFLGTFRYILEVARGELTDFTTIFSQVRHLPQGILVAIILVAGNFIIWAVPFFVSDLLLSSSAGEPMDTILLGIVILLFCITFMVSSCFTALLAISVIFHLDAEIPLLRAFRETLRYSYRNKITIMMISSFLGVLMAVATALTIYTGAFWLVPVVMCSLYVMIYLAITGQEHCKSPQEGDEQEDDESW